MKKIIGTLILGGALAAGSAAQAATTLDATGFSLTWLTGLSVTGPFSMNLLSDANGTARIGLNMGLQGYDVDTFRDHGPMLNADFAWSQLAGSVQQGYRITSMTFSAVVNGTRYLQSLPCESCYIQEGEATNNAGLGVALTQDGQRTELPGARAHNVIGQQNLATTGAVGLERDFVLDLFAGNDVSATGTVQTAFGPDWSSEYVLQATASIAVTDFVLTVQVAPVPEPSTYAMLLAGLGVAGWAARRKPRR